MSGPHSIVDNPGGGAAGPDIYSPTLVVNATGANANFTTLEAALAALPVAGGKIFVREGSYTVPAGGYIMPDSDVEIVCAGRGATIFTRAAGGAGDAFNIGFNRYYRFAGFTIIGDHAGSAQVAFRRSAAASPKRIKIEDVNVGSTLASANGMRTILSSGGLQTNWDVSDCDFLTPAFPTPGVLLAGSALDEVNLARVRTAGRAEISGSPIINAVALSIPTAVGGNPAVFGGGSRVVSSFLPAAGVTFGAGCFIANSTVATGGTIPTGADCEFVGCTLGTVTASGSNVKISGSSYVAFTSITPLSGHILSGNRGASTILLTDTTDCVIVGHAGSLTVTETGTSNRNRFANCDFAGAPTIVGADDIIEGSQKTAVTGAATGAAFATVAGFPVVSTKGLFGIGTIKNTGANPMEVREVVTDAFGVTVTSSPVVPVPAGSDYMLDPQTNFTDGVLNARPPYLSYSVEVRHTVLATTYDLQFAAQGTVT